MKLKFQNFVSAEKVCDWVNKHPMCQILSITEFRSYTVFYYDLTEINTIRPAMHESCDPGFYAPSVSVPQYPPFATTCTAIN